MYGGHHENELLEFRWERDMVSEGQQTEAKAYGLWAHGRHTEPLWGPAELASND